MSLSQRDIGWQTREFEAGIRGESLVVPPEGRPHRVQIDAVMSQANVPWSIGVEADGWELMQHFVTQNWVVDSQ